MWPQELASARAQAALLLSLSTARRAALFDMDGTLLRWTCGGWGPTKLADYSMWNERVPTLLRRLHDDGYKIVIMGNGKDSLPVILGGDTAAAPTRVPPVTSTPSSTKKEVAGAL